jgi:hypothetical protein
MGASESGEMASNSWDWYFELKFDNKKKILKGSIPLWSLMSFFCVT